MKRFHIIALAALSFSAAIAVAIDCNADAVTQKHKTEISIGRNGPDLNPVCVSIDQSFISPEVFAPVFVSNFNRLVIFPETGSDALCEGFASMARGPPKS
jgi:hypothetical protein